MNNRWSTHTSEKLFLAELQLNQWELIANKQDAKASNAIQASFKQASVALMYMAWESFLNEFAEFHQYKAGNIANLTQLRESLGDDLSELVCLSEMANDRNGWIYQLIALNRMIREPRPNETQATELAIDSSSLIAAVGKPEPTDSLQSIKHILNEFKNYLKEFRSRMSEW